MANGSYRAARDLSRRGWAVIPVPPRSKAPAIPKWPELRLSEAAIEKHFRGQSLNIGVLMGQASGGLVDIDLDDPDAIELAEQFLPPTGCVWGRASKRRSHYLYRCAGISKTQRIETVERGGCVEIRSNGAQTIAPGSVHPSGELVEFDDVGEPAEVGAEELVGAVEALAAAVRARRRLNRPGLAEIVIVEAEGEPEASTNGRQERPAPRDRSAGQGGTERRAGDQGRGRYGAAALEGEADQVRQSPEGGRNNRLNSAALKLGKLIAGGELEREAVEAGLLDAALAAGLGEREAKRTIRSGVEAGLKEPKRRPDPTTPMAGHAGGDLSGIASQQAGGDDGADGWREFPIEHLPGPMRRIVAEVVESVGCDPSMAALPALALMASALGNRAEIAIKRDHRLRAVLWLATVASSGSGKSPGCRAVLEPAKIVERRLNAEYADALKEFEAQTQRYEIDLAQWKKSGGDGEPPEAPEPPRRERVKMSNVTIEAVAPVLRDNPLGVLLFRGELGGFFGSFGAYKNGRGGDAQGWIEIFDQDDLSIDRVGKFLNVRRPFLALFGTIQRGTFARCVTPEHFESGLAQRLLIAMPPHSPPEDYPESEVSEATALEWLGVYESIRAIECEFAEDGSPIPRTLRFDAEGREVWLNQARAFRRRMKHADERGCSVLAKCEEAAGKLAMVHAIVERAEGGAVPDLDEPIGRRSAEAGAALAEWFACEARRAYGVLDQERDAQQGRAGQVVGADERAERALKIAERRGGAISPRDLQRADARLWRTKADAMATLEQLVSAGRGVWRYPAPGKGGGAPARQFEVVSGGQSDTTGVLGGVKTPDSSPKSDATPG